MGEAAGLGFGTEVGIGGEGVEGEIGEVGRSETGVATRAAISTGPLLVIEETGVPE